MSVNRASEVWKEIKPFAIRDMNSMIDNKSGDGSDDLYAIILYDESAQKIKYYSYSSEGLTAALLAASSGDIVFMPAGTIEAGGSGTPIVYSAVGSGKAISLGAWGTPPPSGWSITGFDDSTWNSLLEQTLNGWVKPAGSTWVTYSTGDVSGIEWILRHEFFVESSLTTGLEIEVNVDNYIQEIWLNGVKIYDTQITGSSNSTQTISLSSEQIIEGQTNCIGFLIRNLNDAGAKTSLAYSVLFSGSIGVTIPEGVELVGLGKNSIIDGGVENNGILTNLQITGTIIGTGISRMVSNPDVELFSNQIKSLVSVGTSPFLITSTTMVPNLNADLLDGKHANELLANLEYSTAQITFPPTQSEIITIFGEPSIAGEGKLGIIDSNGENNNLYLVVSDGVNWHCFPVSKTQVIGIQSLSSPNILFVGDSVKTYHTFQPCHETNIQEINLGGFKYWAYYTTGVDAPNFEVHLARSNSLHSGWVDYGKVFDGRWPSVYYDGSTFHMIYREASVNLQLKYATSTDGISWTFQKDISVGNNPFLWKNPNDSNWYLFYHDTGGNGHRILYRAAGTISSLDSATPTVLIDQAAIIASPSIAFYLSKYWLTCETYPGGIWNTVLYSSDAISGTYVEHTDSPILTNDDACAIQLLYNDVLYLYYSEKTGTGISWDYWDVVLRYATITSDGSVENLSRVIAFNDTQANITELTGVLGELKFAYDSTNNLLGYSVDGINWYWASDTNIDDDAIHDNVSGEINAITEKSAIVGADVLLGEDSEDGYNKKRILISSLPIPDFGELLVDDGMNLLFDDNGDLVYEE